MLERVLLLDTETTGLDPAHDTTIEVAGILYDLRLGMLRCYSSLLPAAENPAEAINGIPAAAIATMDEAWAVYVWKDMMELAVSADAICAHRAEFDRGFVPADFRDHKPWICTKFDVQWPRTELGAGLVAMALGLGLGVSHAHRALTDCITMARIMDRVREMGENLPALLARGLRPKAQFQALVSYDDREQAKAAAFQWEPTTKRWLRTMAIEDAEALPFKVRVVKS